MRYGKASVAGINEPTRYGRRSILYAVCAFVLVLGMFVAYGLTAEGAPRSWSDFTGTAAAAAFLVAAPILHLVGIFIGVRGLFQAAENKAVCVLGIALNIGLLGLGVFLVLLILPAATAFR